MEQSLVTLLLVIATVFISYKGFSHAGFLRRYCFDVNQILVRKEYIRLLSSGFLHSGWWHLIFNMIALLAFGSLLEPFTGSGTFLLIYFGSLTGSELLVLFIHRSRQEYTSVGASGAINGIVFAAIALFPDMGIGLFLLPVSVPAWAFGLAYIVFTIYGLKASWGNTGHAAHLGGALVGMVAAIAFYPQMAAANYLPILLMTVPTVAAMLAFLYKPQSLLTGSAAKQRRFASIDHEYNYRKTQEQAGLDHILEKIHRNGMKSLTRKEKEILEAYSKVNR